MTLTTQATDDAPTAEIPPRPTLAQQLANSAERSVFIVELTRPWDQALVVTALEAAGVKFVKAIHPEPQESETSAPAESTP